MLRTSPASAAIVGPHFKQVRPGRSRPARHRGRRPASAFVAVRTHLKGDAKPRWTGSPSAGLRRAHRPRSARTWRSIRSSTSATTPRSATARPSTRASWSATAASSAATSSCIPHVVLYEGVTLGDRVEVHAGTVLGGDGFGYRMVDGRHVKMPADRARRGRRRRRDRRELHDRPRHVRGDGDRRGVEDRQPRHDRPQQPDRPAQPALRPGRHRRAVARRATTWSWPARPGSRTTPRSATASIVGAQAGVHRNIPAGQQVLGSPAIPVSEQRRIFQMIARLPEMHRQLRELAAQVAAPDRRESADEPEPDRHMDDVLTTRPAYRRPDARPGSRPSATSS